MVKQKEVKNSTKLADFVPKLEADAAGVASIADWKGTILEETALKLLPQARSVVVFAMEVHPEVLALSSSERVMGAAAPSDLIARNAEYLYGRATKAAYDVVKASHEAGLKALALPGSGCPQDSRFIRAVFSYKHAGQAAGLGKIGWHSLLITPRFGPRVRLACCLTEAALEPTTLELALPCADCGVCVKNCPAGAMSEPPPGEQYAINKFACSAYRSASGGGCCECMRLCPMSQ